MCPNAFSSLTLATLSRSPSMLPCLFRMRLSSFPQDIHTFGFKEGFLKSVQAFVEWIGVFWGPVLLGLILINVHLLRSSLHLRKRNRKMDLSLSVQLDG